MFSQDDASVLYGFGRYDGPRIGVNSGVTSLRLEDYALWKCKWQDARCDVLHVLNQRTVVSGPAILSEGNYLYLPTPSLESEAIYDCQAGRSLWEINARGDKQFRTHFANSSNTRIFALDMPMMPPRNRDNAIIFDGTTGQVQPATFRGVWAITNDGRLVFVAPDVLDAISGRVICRISKHTSTLSAMFSNDARTLAVGDFDGAVSLWNIATGQLIARFETHAGEIRGLRFSTDSRKFAAMSLGEVPGTHQSTARFFLWSGHAAP
jgi:WD40 repeat protein